MRCNRAPSVPKSGDSDSAWMSAPAGNMLLGKATMPRGWAMATAFNATWPAVDYSAACALSAGTPWALRFDRAPPAFAAAARRPALQEVLELAPPGAWRSVGRGLCRPKPCASCEHPWRASATCGDSLAHCLTRWTALSAGVAWTPHDGSSACGGRSRCVMYFPGPQNTGAGDPA